MTIRTATQLRKNLESIKKDNEVRIEKLESRLTEIEERRGDTRNIQRELDQARTAAARSEALAEKALQVAEDRELKAAQDAEETRKRVAAELESRQKFRAERTWVAAGGDPKGFETAWPALREKLLEQAVLDGNESSEESQTLVQSL